MAEDKPTLPSFPYETLPDTRPVSLPTFGELIQSTGAPPARRERYDNPQAPPVTAESPAPTLGHDRPSAGPDAVQSTRAATPIEVPPREAEGAATEPTIRSPKSTCVLHASSPVMVTFAYHFWRRKFYDEEEEAIATSTRQRFLRIINFFDCPYADAEVRLNNILLNWIRE